MPMVLMANIKLIDWVEVLCPNWHRICSCSSQPMANVKHPYSCCHSANLICISVFWWCWSSWVGWQ